MQSIKNMFAKCCKIGNIISLYYYYFIVYSIHELIINIKICGILKTIFNVFAEKNIFRINKIFYLFHNLCILYIFF